MKKILENSQETRLSQGTASFPLVATKPQVWLKIFVVSYLLVQKNHLMCCHFKVFLAKHLSNAFKKVVLNPFCIRSGFYKKLIKHAKIFK